MIVQNIGLILNVIGTLFIAFSMGRFPKEFGGSTVGSDGKEYHFVYLTHPYWFNLGIMPIVIGFLLQISI